VAPLWLRGGARRRPLTQGGCGGRGVHALALHTLRHECGSQHRAYSKNACMVGPNMVARTHW
jgi:hypothetical protein